MYTTSVDLQKCVRIQVYQGDANMCSENQKLREFNIPIEPLLRVFPIYTLRFLFRKTLC